jgi:RNA polymerase sigma-70 factor (ECF subfamily)
MAAHAHALGPHVALTGYRRLWETGWVSSGDTQLVAAHTKVGNDFVDRFMANERRLRLLAFGVLRDPDLVDDALQETALRAYRSLGRFRGDAKFGTWLHRITVRVCYDLIRETKRQATLAERSLQTRAGVPEPDAALDAHTRLAQALDTLTPEQRAVAVVVLQLGFDLRSAATILAIPRGTVASRLFAARQALAAALGSEEEDDG